MKKPMLSALVALVSLFGAQQSAVAFDDSPRVVSTTDEARAAARARLYESMPKAAGTTATSTRARVQPEPRLIGSTDDARAAFIAPPRDRTSTVQLATADNRMAPPLSTDEARAMFGATLLANFELCDL